MFDKEEYWKRRNNTVEEEHEEKDDKGKVKKVMVQVAKPLRGQGDPVKRSHLVSTDFEHSPKHFLPGTGMINRRQYRAALRGK